VPPGSQTTTDSATSRVERKVVKIEETRSRRCVAPRTHHAAARRAGNRAVPPCARAKV